MRPLDRPLRGLVAALAVTLSLASAGCPMVDVDSDLPAAGEVEVFRTHRWAWGLFGGHIDVGPQPVSRVVVEGSICDWFMAFVTWGFYCPATVTVWYADDFAVDAKRLR